MTFIEAQAEAWRLGFTTFSVTCKGWGTEMRVQWDATRAGIPTKWAGAIDVAPDDVGKYLPMLLDSAVMAMQRWATEQYS